MELRQLRYFLTVKETQKISAAADLLHVTQPTLTISIRHLEEELGVILFERSNKGLQLTEAGEAFSIHAEKILKRVDTAVSDMEKYRYAAPLEVGIPSISCELVYRLIYQDFQQRYPQIRFTINDILSSEAIDKVADDEMEVGFCIVRNALPEELSFLEVAQGEIPLLVRRDRFPEEQERLPLEDALAYPWIFNRRSNKQTTTEKIVREFFEEKGLSLPQISYIKDHHTIISNVSLGLGIYPYPNTNHSDPFKVYPELRSMRIAEGIFYQMGMVYKKERKLSASARILIEWVKELPHQSSVNRTNEKTLSQ